jgi:hypothetical protein
MVVLVLVLVLVLWCEARDVIWLFQGIPVVSEASL